MEALNQVPGLLTKASLHDRTTVVGFHLFAAKADSDAYLASDLVQGLITDIAEARGISSS